MEIQHYQNVFDKKGQETNIDVVLEDIKNGKYKSEIDRIRAEKNHDVRQSLKNKLLPAVTFGGTFSIRNKESLSKSTGLVTVDFDNGSGITLENAEELKQKISKIPFVFAIFKSPSGFLKILVKIPKVTNNDEYRKFWVFVDKYLREEFKISQDVSGKDISRLCFYSYDEKIYINKKATDFQIDEKEKQAEIKLNNERKEKEQPKQPKNKEKVLNGLNSYKIDRSEEDIKKILQLLGQNKTKEYIFKYMIETSTKFSSETENYKERTFENAAKFFDENKNKSNNIKNVSNTLYFVSSCKRNNISRDKATEILSKSTGVADETTQEDFIKDIYGEVIPFEDVKGQIETAQEFDKKDFPEKEWLIKGIIPKNSIVMISSLPKCFKTNLAINISSCLSSGFDFFNQEVKSPKKVLYWDKENNSEDVWGMRKKMSHFQKFTSENFYRINLPIYLDVEEHKESFGKILDVLKPDLVVLDSLQDFMIGDINSARDTAVFYETLKIYKNKGVSFLILAHQNKGNANNLSQNQNTLQLRNSGSINNTAQLDMLFFLERKGEKFNFIFGTGRFKEELNFDFSVEDKDNGILLKYLGEVKDFDISRQDKGKKAILELLNQDYPNSEVKKSTLAEHLSRVLGISTRNNTIENVLRDLILSEKIEKVRNGLFRLPINHKLKVENEEM